MRSGMRSPALSSDGEDLAPAPAPAGPSIANESFAHMKGHELVVDRKATAHEFQRDVDIMRAHIRRTRARVWIPTRHKWIMVWDLIGAHPPRRPCRGTVAPLLLLTLPRPAVRSWWGCTVRVGRQPGRGDLASRTKRYHCLYGRRRMQRSALSRTTSPQPWGPLPLPLAPRTGSCHRLSACPPRRSFSRVICSSVSIGRTASGARKALVGSSTVAVSRGTTCVAGS